MEPSSIDHFGDTGEFFVGIAIKKCADEERRKWSPFRAWTSGLALLAVVMFTCTMIGRPGHRIVELTDGGTAALRASCTVLVVLAVLATCYELVAPKFWRHFAAMRVGMRALEQMIETANARMATLDERMSELTEALETYGADKRQDGYESALRDSALPEIPPQRRVGAIATNGHLHSL